MVEILWLHMARVADLREGVLLPSTQRGSVRTSEAEFALGLEPSVYFFLGHCWPSFGSVAMALEWAGLSSESVLVPMDSGMLLADGSLTHHPGYLPLRDLPPEVRGQRAVQLHRQVSCKLSAGAEEVAAYVAACHSKAEGYLNCGRIEKGPARPSLGSRWIGLDLPASYPENVDPRGWTWEAAVPGRVSLDARNLVVFCSAGDRNHLEELADRAGAPGELASLVARLEALKAVEPTTLQDPAGRLREHLCPHTSGSPGVEA